MARARQPFLTPEELHILYQWCVYPTKAQEEQALAKVLQKLSTQPYLGRGDRFHYDMGYVKLLMIQAMDDQQYQREFEHHAQDKKHVLVMLSRQEKLFATYTTVLKWTVWIVAGLLFLLLLSILVS
jgi:hypothetical protein